MINHDDFPFAIGDRVTVEREGRTRPLTEGTIMGVSPSGLTLQEGFTHAHWVPWGAIRSIELTAEERRIDEIAEALARRVAQAKTGHPAPADGDAELREMGH